MRKNRPKTLLRQIPFLALTFFVFLQTGGIASAANTAVIFAYFRIGEDAYPASNIRLDQFEEHLNELQNGGYAILPVPEIIAALRENRELPENTVGLTFEGGYRSTLENAVPLLKKYNFPFTVFIVPDRIDSDTESFLDWNEIRKLEKNKKISIGALPASYEHLTTLDEPSLRLLLNRSAARFREELGETPALFAYPFGEYSPGVRQLVGEHGFSAAFGQQSGVIGTKADFFALPRFTMTENFGGLDRFRLIASALPLAVSDVVPETPEITENPPQIGFTISDGQSDLSALACFASGQEKPELVMIEGNRVELRLAEPFTAERARINCTVPEKETTPGRPQRWHWFGMLFAVP